ncbi:unnamed protein product [Brassica napus]|uniref:(rape) hypothetical protein n=1 Tax=Brassica napus TaxID=3708 RepID=A0A816I487_BRANA|nr:unnamed protein product [Brassica napus]
MGRRKLFYQETYVSFFVSLVFIFHRGVICQDDSSLDNPAANRLYNQFVFDKISNLTEVFEDDIKRELGFCITNVKEDYNEAFNFSSKPGFLNKCGKTTKGDMMQRICTAAEVRIYFNGLLGGAKRATNYLKPNKNCNLSSWMFGCEPGWACRTAKDVKVDLKDDKNVPVRTQQCAPYCAGFFCPRGITCMIPCPLGAYCPEAKLNRTTGLCDPYHYQLPSGQPNHTCGGADIWADIVSSSEVFCSAGSFCPSTIDKLPCTRGHFCRTGSTAEKNCFKLATCNPRSTNQNITAYGIMLFAGLGFLLIILYNCSDQVLATRERRQAKIEKEKAMQEQNKNLTFSGVISMANDIEIRKRPTIEVAFKDLTITLKGKNKHLMRCVTGKLSPGRVSAVMGPSGAGKTTFLTALTGKAAGCTMSGMILVNGKVESIQSYKRIIGFVPQDDIVHGNLTVEENLWFSARCRLPADLPKPEKVLVVERVIESLGLQHVRDSMVGTVEKRGISGGQRKRVNVGLEMVMEPSLLVLDEPTSGLDSSSSQLLLRALRREALEGVNICMVVHQPSYTLFRMFDDLILLAKGGLICYQGSVKKVEEYFSSLGIVVPERVNPPDYYIDILEGILKPSTSSGVTYKQLPVRWMLHNGYPVPSDMLKSIEGMASAENSAHGGSAHGSVVGDDGTSFAGEFWQDVKANVEIKKDTLQNNFSNSGDLSQRQVPGVYQQFRYFLGRLGKQRLREARTLAVDYLILLLAGICLGTLAKVSDETFGAMGYTYTVIAVSLLCKITALRSFSLDKLHYWRESRAGMSSLAYFLAKDTVDYFNTIVKPLVYLSMFYFFNNPRSSVGDNYIVLICLVYCVTGIAFALAILFEPGPAQLWSVLLPVVLTLIATSTNDNKIVESISELCYTRWALEAFVVSNAQRSLAYHSLWITDGEWVQHQALPSLPHLPDINRFFCMVTFQKKQL